MEIGGYLEYEKYYGQEYHTGCLKLNTARNALKYLIEARKIKKLWISKWNCSAILDTCRNSEINIGFFDLDVEFKPILPNDYKQDDYVYVVNYYGQLPNMNINHLIVDNVQAFYQRPQIGIDTIYTCRKYFGVTDGAYLYTTARLDRELKQDSSYARISYLAGRFEHTGSDFYEQYQHNERLLNDLPLMKMSSFTENILSSIDYEFIKKRREENFQYLHKTLGQYNLLNIRIPSGPFAYPLMIKDGCKIRRRLQLDKIYIAKLWPNVSQGQEGILADNILPLPCDQRYTVSDMKYLADIVIAYISEGDQL